MAWIITRKPTEDSREFFYNGEDFAGELSTAVRFKTEREAWKEIQKEGMPNCDPRELAVSGPQPSKPETFGAPQGPETRAEVAKRIELMDEHICKLQDEIKSVQFDLDTAKGVEGWRIVGENFKDMLEFQQDYALGKVFLVDLELNSEKPTTLVIRVTKVPNPMSDMPEGCVVEGYFPLLIHGIPEVFSNLAVDAYCPSVYGGKVVGVYDDYNDYLNECYEVIKKAEEENAPKAPHPRISIPKQCPYQCDIGSCKAGSYDECAKCPFYSYCVPDEDDDDLF